MENELLKKLSGWYSEHCDGEWEHHSGITISTLDNPGWMLKVDLRGTSAEYATFEAVNIDNGESDWLSCSKKDGEFVAAGDPSKLAALLEHFVKFVGKP